MIILDTTVISELVRPTPNRDVIDWVDGQPSGEIHITAITLAELLYGVARLPDGRRKRGLAEHIEAMVDQDLDHRVLTFDETAAIHYADIVVRRERAGRPISSADAQIAAIARSHGAILATRNTDDFSDTSAKIVNPWSKSK